MSKTALPPEVEGVIDAVNRGDTEGFLSCLADDGVVDDWGARYIGRAAIRAWSDHELIGARGTMTILGARRTADEVDVSADWISDFYRGTAQLGFVVAGDEVRQIRIRSGA